MISFKTGELSQGEIEAILNTIPGDITFVGKDDMIRYFNEPAKRLFTRNSSIMGTSVQQCHPDKSVASVNQVLEDLKTGRKDIAEFRVGMEGRLISIHYLAVRDGDGEYLGCLEFAQQDVSHVKTQGVPET